MFVAQLYSVRVLARLLPLSLCVLLVTATVSPRTKSSNSNKKHIFSMKNMCLEAFHYCVSVHDESHGHEKKLEQNCWVGFIIMECWNPWWAREKASGSRYSWHILVRDHRQRVWDRATITTAERRKNEFLEIITKPLITQIKVMISDKICHFWSIPFHQLQGWFHHVCYDKIKI